MTQKKVKPKSRKLRRVKPSRRDEDSLLLEAEELLQISATQIKDAYAREKVLMSGSRAGGYRPSPKFEACWFRCADFMLRNHLSPVVCVRAKVQRTVIEQSRMPWPTELYSKKDLSFYKEVSADNVRHVENEFRSQKAVCRNYLNSFAVGFDMSNEGRLEFCLLNETLPFSPLFRYCLASSEQIRSVTDRYRDFAINQYLADRATYDLVWGDWVPRHLRKHSDAVQKLVPFCAERRIEQLQKKK
jgi:hypothetical protein